VGTSDVTIEVGARIDLRKTTILDISPKLTIGTGASGAEVRLPGMSAGGGDYLDI
jgi:hypothetical protein